MFTTVTHSASLSLYADRVDIPVLVVPVTAAGRLCVSATVADVHYSAENNRSVPGCLNTSRQASFCALLASHVQNVL
jgi:hypothetical protein